MYIVSLYQYIRFNELDNLLILEKYYAINTFLNSHIQVHEYKINYFHCY